MSGVVISIDDKKLAKASIAPLMGLVENDMKRVNALILSKTGSDGSDVRL